MGIKKNAMIYANNTNGTKFIEIMKFIEIIEKNQKSFSIFGNSGEILVSVFHVRHF